jgi:hypothetical protein
MGAHSGSPEDRAFEKNGLIAKATGPKPVKYREGIGRLRDRCINRIEIDRDQGSNSGTQSLYGGRAWHFDLSAGIDVS